MRFFCRRHGLQKPNHSPSIRASSHRLSFFRYSLLSGLLLVWAEHCGFAQPARQFMNGGFEDGLKGWRFAGAVRLKTNDVLQGKFSVVIGPGPGSLTQRIRTGSGDHVTVSAMIQAQHTNAWVFALRFLDAAGRELMKVDSIRDMARTREDPRKFSQYLKEHPLTTWTEIVISNNSPDGSLLVDQVALNVEDENAEGLRPTCDLDQAMQPFWRGKRVFNEAILLVSKDGKPAAGQLLFHPSRVISVQDYGLATNYSEGVDYTLEERTLSCTASSRMTRVREEDLPEGELKWSSVGGKQVMVTYEHEDAWDYPHPTFVGNQLPNTIRKLNARAPLSVVAYGDSITYGLGESRLSHIAPFLPPWPELFVHRLKAIYRDEQIQFFNSAQSGANSNWARDYAERMVASLNPDLVLIAFGQNDFWGISARSFADNITATIQAIRRKHPKVEFLLVSTMRFDPVYTTNAQYWSRVGEYAAQLQAMARPGVQFVDMTAISESIYAAKKPKDCINDPLHPNDYLARWYAQSVIATLDPASGGSLQPVEKRKKPMVQPGANH